MEERWEDVPGLPLYAVSSYGTVLNKETGRELKPDADSRGYRKVRLYEGKGRRRHYYVHRLVAEAFFLNYQDGIAVHFKNDDFGDCSVLNLTLEEKKRCRPRES